MSNLKRRQRSKLNDNYSLEHIRAYYESDTDLNDENYKILGWESREAQRLRFSILLQQVSLNGKSILDVGCGLGDLFFYCKEMGVDYFTYLGVDISKMIIDRAIELEPTLNVKYTDIFTDNQFRKEENFDVIFTSGIFNLKFGDNNQFFKDALAYFFDISNEYIVFNLLSNSSLNKEDTYYYYDSAHVEEIVKSFDFREAKVVDDYLHNDFTIICRK